MIAGSTMTLAAGTRFGPRARYTSRMPPEPAQRQRDERHARHGGEQVAEPRRQVSALFLTSYVIYHLDVGSVPFRGTGLMRTVYFAVLIPHVILAAGIVPLVIVTVLRGLSAKYDKHRRIARWTLPLWLYVSVTGVIVYLMLYQM